MRILIVSDTHGRDKAFLSLYSQLEPLDMVIHLGDLEGSEDKLAKKIKCPFYAVAGNNDYFTSLPAEQEIMIGKYKAFLCHGHRYQVTFGTKYLADEAASRGCDIAMFGHIHRPLIEESDGVTILNPGSISLPRQENHRPSYIMMDIDRFGEAHYNICYL